MVLLSASIELISILLQSNLPIAESCKNGNSPVFTNTTTLSDVILLLVVKLGFNLVSREISISDHNGLDEETTHKV